MMIKKIFASMEEFSPSAISDKLVTVLKQQTNNETEGDLQHNEETLLEENSILLNDTANAGSEIKLLEEANQELKEQLDNSEATPVDEVALELLNIKNNYIEKRWGLKVIGKSNISVEDFNELPLSGKISETKELTETLDEGLKTSSEVVSKGSVIAVDGIIDTLKKLALREFSKDAKTLIESMDWEEKPGAVISINDPVLLSLTRGENEEPSINNVQTSLEKLKSVIDECFGDVLFSKLASYFDGSTDISPFEVLKEIFKKGDDGHLTPGHKHLKLADVSIGGDNLIIVLGSEGEESFDIVIEKDDTEITSCELSVPNKADVLSLIDTLNEIKKSVIENLEKMDELQGKVRTRLKEHPVDTCPSLVKLSTLLPEWIVKGVIKLVTSINDFIITSAESSKLSLGTLDESLLDQDQGHQETFQDEDEVADLNNQVRFVDEIYQASDDAVHLENMKAVIEDEIQNGRPVSKLAVELYISSIKGICKRWGFPLRSISKLSLESLNEGSYNTKMENLKLVLESSNSVASNIVNFISEAIEKAIQWLSETWDEFINGSEKTLAKIKNISQFVESGYGGDSSLKVKENIERDLDTSLGHRLYLTFSQTGPINTEIGPIEIEEAFKSNTEELEAFNRKIIDPITKDLTEVILSTPEDVTDIVSKFIYRDISQAKNVEMDSSITPTVAIPLITPLGKYAILVDKKDPLDVKFKSNSLISFAPVVQTAPEERIVNMCQLVIGHFNKFKKDNTAIKDQVKNLKKLKKERKDSANDKKAIAFLLRLLTAYSRCLLESNRTGLKGTLVYLNVCGYDKGLN